MAFSGLFCLVVLLWFSSQLAKVLAGKREWRKNLHDWLEETGGYSGKVIETWLYVRTGHRRLYTEVKTGGASWFITPSLNLPNTSYLEMESSCSNSPCQLEVYGTRQSSARVFKNNELVQNLTFETQRISTTAIKKSYPHLLILARTSETSTTTKFSIYSIKLYHYFCENRTLYNTDLSQVHSSTTNTSKLVQCPDNAIASDGKSTNITVKCTPKGSWVFKDLKCVCDKGFFFSNQRCLGCLSDHYKTTIANERCQKCPDGRTNNTMHTQCKCKKDHYIGDDKDGPCYGIFFEIFDLVETECFCW